MTREEFDNQIDEVFNDNIADGSLSPSAEAAAFKLLANYAEQQKAPYKSYIGKFNQDGDNLPVVTEVLNDIFESITWTQNEAAPGNFTGTIVGGEFTAGKTFIPNRRFSIFAGGATGTGAVNVYLQAYGTVFNVNVNDGVSGVNGNWFEFEIRVYN